jgi:hypothetical protein
LDIISNNRLHFDHLTQTGVILHMFSNVDTTGEIGVTAVGDSHEDARSIFRWFDGVLGAPGWRGTATGRCMCGENG